MRLLNISILLPPKVPKMGDFQLQILYFGRKKNSDYKSLSDRLIFMGKQLVAPCRDATGSENQKSV